MPALSSPPEPQIVVKRLLAGHYQRDIIELGDPSVNDEDRLQHLEAQLQSSGKLWMYASRVSGKPLSDPERIAIAKSVLAAQKPWAQGVLADFASREYPPGYEED